MLFVKSEKILVALSGGVDSSVAAALLREAGHDLVGVTLKTFCYGDIVGGPKSCCGLEGIEAARAVASTLGIPHLVLDATEEFRHAVIDDFVAEYAAGRTPNPCVRCNATVKIPSLLERGRRLGCSAVATGHYARVVHDDEGWWLRRGQDAGKDQSYFLWELPAEVLPHLLLPVGELAKPEVRRLAQKFGFGNAQKPESQEICFIPDQDYLAFLRRMLPADHPGFAPGALVDADGRRLGTHSGYLGYTIGQRKGLGGGHGRRLFVVAIDPGRCEVVVGPEEELCGTRLIMERVNMLTLSPPPASDEPLLVQIRHRHKAVPCQLHEVMADGAWHLTFPDPVRAITPGQSAVVYRDETVIAGGRIRFSGRGGTRR
jgi:tRNA-uridine 2-sulfurtransferase